MSVSEHLTFLASSLNLNPFEKPDCLVSVKIKDLAQQWTLSRDGVVLLNPECFCVGSGKGLLHEGISFKLRFAETPVFEVANDTFQVSFFAEGQQHKLLIQPRSEADLPEWQRFLFQFCLRVFGFPRVGQAWPEQVPFPRIPGSLQDGLKGFALAHSKLPGNPFVLAWSGFFALMTESLELTREFLNRSGAAADEFTQTCRALIHLRQGQPILAMEQIRPHLPKVNLSSTSLSRKIFSIAAASADHRENFRQGKEVQGSVIGWSRGYGFPQALKPKLLSLFVDRFDEPFSCLLSGWQALETANESMSQGFLDQYRQSSKTEPLEIIRLEAALYNASGNLEQAWHLLNASRDPEMAIPFLSLSVELGRGKQIQDFVQANAKDSSTALGAFLCGEILATAGAAIPHIGSAKAWPPQQQIWRILHEIEITLRKEDFPRATELLSSLGNYSESNFPLLPTPLGFSPLPFLPPETGSSLHIWCRTQILLRWAKKPGSFSLGIDFPISRLILNLAKKHSWPRERDLLARASGNSESLGISPVPLPSSSPASPRMLADLLQASLNLFPDQSNPERQQLDHLIRDSRLPPLVAVMGEFNAGKSTLINAFLEKTVLPEGFLPTTPLPCLLRFGEYPLAILVRADGSRLYHSITDLNDLFHVPASTPSKEVRDLREIEILLPHPLLKTVWFVDTPGLNSGNATHQQATEAFVRRADAILWVCDANQAGRASEIEAVHKLLNPAQQVLLAVNRMDEIDPSERDEVVEQLQSQLGNRVSGIFAVSARQALGGATTSDSSALRNSFARFRDQVRDTILACPDAVKTATISWRLHHLLEQGKNLLRERQSRRLTMILTLSSFLKTFSTTGSQAHVSGKTFSTLGKSLSTLSLESSDDPHLREFLARLQEVIIHADSRTASESDPEGVSEQSPATQGFPQFSSDIIFRGLDFAHEYLIAAHETTQEQFEAPLKNLLLALRDNSPALVSTSKTTP